MTQIEVRLANIRFCSNPIDTHKFVSMVIQSTHHTDTIVRMSPRDSGVVV